VYQFSVATELPEISHESIQPGERNCIKFCDILFSYGSATINFIYRISPPIRRTVIFSLETLEKNNDECILILVIYWKKTRLLHTKISNHNTIYSAQKSRKSSSLPLKSSSWLFSLNAGTGIYKFGNNTYTRCIKCRSNLGHIFRGKECVLWAGKYVKCESTQDVANIAPDC